MRDYGKVSPHFWIGRTGKELRQAGPESQLVALYLLTSPHANMIGLYYMPLAFLSHETGLTMEGAKKGLNSAIKAGFCKYDEHSEMVWVIEMATHQIGEALKPGDKRCTGVQNEYNKVSDNLFLSEFYEKYSKQFNMTCPRSSELQIPDVNEGALKGLASQEQEQEQEKEQDQTTLSDSNRTDGDKPDELKGQPAQGKPDSKSDDAESPDPVDAAFENIFWGAGLRKDAKVKAKSAFRTKYRDWKKANRGTPENFAVMLAEDISLRVKTQQMGFDKLLPASYLNGERWNDEKPNGAPQISASANAIGGTGASWFAKPSDGSAEVFISQAAIDRMKRGANRP
ncbi:hypothetical protein DBU22_002422 [Escherichia coli O21]|uniref:hypothetical protein n=1 Tax=Escherichia coli TaxID=562 RepID=UPI000BE5BD3F|nr:hypothetical protein [Escherichia coli]EEZ6616373.1 hypothetical protein [Escherichia coli O21]